MPARWLLLPIVALLACGDNNPVASVHGDASVPGDASVHGYVVPLGGDGQTGTVGAALASPFTISVTDAGQPVAGISVSFVVTAGSGTLSVTSVVTDEYGQAHTRLTLGTTAGTNTVEASVPGFAGSPVTFTAVGVAGAPAQLLATAGTGQSAVVGSQLAAPFVVTVEDAYSNPIDGATVDFDVIGGGGTVSSSNSTSDMAGRAETSLTLGTTVGANTVEARVTSGSGSVVFTAMGLAGAAGQIVLSAGSNQTGTPASTLEPFVVTVEDLYGNPVSGVSVSFAVISGGGSLSPTTVVTNAMGEAQTTMTLGTTPGLVTLEANAPGMVSVMFTATVSVGPPAQVAVTSGSNQTALENSTLASPLVVTVTDAYGNPIAGVSVSFVVTAGGGSPSVPVTTTDANGMAQTSWTLGPTSGTNTLEARVSGLAAAVFTATATAPIGTLQLTFAGSGGGQVTVSDSTTHTTPTTCSASCTVSITPGDEIQLIADSTSALGAFTGACIDETAIGACVFLAPVGVSNVTATFTPPGSGLQWERVLDAPVFGVAQDADGNVLIDQAGGLTKLSPAGVTLWTKNLGGPLATGPGDTIYIAGSDLRKYDASGNLLWTAPLDTNSMNGAIAVGSDGSVAVEGTGLALWDSSGNPLWSTAFDSTNLPPAPPPTGTPPPPSMHAVAIDQNGVVYALVQVDEHDSNGGLYAYALRFQPDGTELPYWQVGSGLVMAGPSGIAVDADGGVELSTYDQGPAAGTANIVFQHTNSAGVMDYGQYDEVDNGFFFPTSLANGVVANSTGQYLWWYVTNDPSQNQDRTWIQGPFGDSVLTVSTDAGSTVGSYSLAAFIPLEPQMGDGIYQFAGPWAVGASYNGNQAVMAGNYFPFDPAANVCFGEVGWVLAFSP